MEHLGRLSFRQIANDIKQAIVDGRYPPASLLPPEPELAAQYGASRSLVNRAMQVLAAEGYIRARQGRGTIVTWLPPMLHSPARYSRDVREQGGARGAFDAEIHALGLDPQHEITTARAEPPARVAAALGVPAGEANCLVRRRRLLASGIPVRLNASWFPLDIVKDSELEDPNAIIVGGVKSALAELGYPQSQATETFSVRAPTESEIAALEISPERSVLDIFHAGAMADGRVVEVTTTASPAHYLIVETSFALA